MSDDAEKKWRRDAEILKNNIVDFSFTDFVRRTPCAREALLDGFGAGIVVGVGFFLATKNIPRACNLAVGGFFIGSALSWEHRRNQLLREKKMAKELVDRLNRIEEEKRISGQ